MFQKYAPLIILAMFVIATYFMIQGMHNAKQMATPKSKQEIAK